MNCNKKCRPASGSRLHSAITKAANKRLKQITNIHLNSDEQTFTLLVNFTGPSFLQREQIETAGLQTVYKDLSSWGPTKGAQEQGLIMTSLQRKGSVDQCKDICC